MPVPSNIQKQIDAGKAAFDALQQGEPIPGLDVEAPQAALEGAPEGEEENFDPQVKVEPDPPPEGSQEEPAPIGEPESDDDLTRARHATATWKGRAQAAKAEQLKLAKQIEQLTETTNAQFNAIAKLQAQMAEVPAKTSAVSPAVDTSTKPLVSPEEREQYGDEFSNFIERLAQQKADQQLKAFAAQIDDRLKDVTGKVEQAATQTKKQVEQEFYRGLDQLVPNWRTLNEDPEFNQWLAERDIYSNDTRKNLLVNACEWADSARAARFFTGFLAEQEAINPGTSTPNPGAGRKVLESMASPGRPRQPASREAPAPEKISDVDARNFYTEVTKGHYKNRPEEKRAIQRRIEAALIRGDITTLQ